MGKNKNKRVEPAAVAGQLVRVVNTREGSIVVVPYGGLVLPPGVSLHEREVFENLSAATLQALEDFEAEGVLRFGEDPKPEPEAAPAKPEPKQVPEGFQPLPADDGLALKAIEAETSSAVLAFWFDRAVDRAAVSDAIMARAAQLDSK